MCADSFCYLCIERTEKSKRLIYFMYTTTMTVDELINEFTADLPQILSISDAKQKKADKIIKKSQLFPVYLHAKIKTKRGNDWLLLIEAKNKKYVGDDCLMTMVSIPLLNGSRYAIMWSSIQGQSIHIIFTPHFFSRYSLRAGIDLKGEDLILRYFKINPSYGFNVMREIIDGNEKINVYGSTNEGVALGVRLFTDKYVVLFKTFITYDMCKGEQIENFAQAEQIRREIHEEMTTLK